MLVGVVVGILLALWIVLALNCPSRGIALTSRAAYLHRQKNRTELPQAGDFDSRITLDALLQPGEDTQRWATARAARVQGD
jgi:hypothetical protein